MPVYTNVVTYSTPRAAGPKLNLCKKHDAEERTRYTERGEPFAQVSHGWHRGTCDECAAERGTDAAGGAS